MSELNQLVAKKSENARKRLLISVYIGGQKYIRVGKFKAFFLKRAYEFVLPTPYVLIVSCWHHVRD